MSLRPCNRRRASVFCMSLRASAHTGVAIRFPRREAWQAGCCSGKFAHTYQVCHCEPRLCNREHLPVLCMSLRGAGQPPRDVAIRVPAEEPGKLAAVWANSHTPTTSVIANQCAHWCGNPRPRRGAWQAGCCSGKFVVLFGFAQSIAFHFVLPQENGLPRRFAPRNDMQKLAACQRLQQRGAGQIRTHLPSLSLRASAHTGVAIRIPAEEPGKLAAVWANSSCFSYLPKVFLFVLWYCKGNGLPRRFAPRNDMLKFAGCSHSNALVRNDMRKVETCQRCQGALPGCRWKTFLLPAFTRFRSFPRRPSGWRARSPAR